MKIYIKDWYDMNKNYTYHECSVVKELKTKIHTDSAKAGFRSLKKSDEFFYTRPDDFYAKELEYEVFIRVNFFKKHMDEVFEDFDKFIKIWEIADFEKNKKKIDSLKELKKNYECGC